MKTKHLYMMILLGILSIGCSSNYPLLNSTKMSEAAELKNYCEKQKISSAYTEKADSLFAVSEAFSSDGKQENAYWSAQLAETHYRLAIADTQLQSSRKQVKKMEKSLWAAKEQLRTYKEVLNEIQDMRLP